MIQIWYNPTTDPVSPEKVVQVLQKILPKDFRVDIFKQIEHMDFRSPKEQSIQKKKVLRTTIPSSIFYYVNRLAAHLEWEDELHKFNQVLAKLTELRSDFVYGLLLKEIALTMDEKYEGHIKDTPYVFVLRTSDNQIEQRITDDIPFPCDKSLFRSIEDLEQAIEILAKPVPKHGK